MSTPSSALTRRRFLRDLGVVGGGAVMLGAMETLGFAPDASALKLPYQAPGAGDFALQGRNNKTSVLVLGAGVAGLAAAYELEKAGYRVQVLEARTRPGGRNWTARQGTRETDIDGVTQTCEFDRDQYMNMGPARIPQHHTTLDYCRELGVPIEVFTNANAQGWYYSEPSGSVGGSLAGTRVRHREAKADHFGYVSELLAKAVNQGALDQSLSAADKEALISFLRSFGGLNAENAYVGGSRRGYPRDDEPGGGFQTGTPLPAPGLSDVLASRLGNNFSFEAGWDQAMLMFQPVGGMDAIPHALARAVKGRITYGADVTLIENTASGVSVTYADGSARPKQVTADFCVCTIPPHILKRIPSNFGTQVAADLDAASPSNAGKIGLQYKRRWWEEDEDLYGGITNTNMDISTIWYPSNGYLGAKGVVVGYYNFGGNANAYGALTPAQRQARALDQGRKVHGDVYATELEKSFSVDWAKTRYSEAGWVGWGRARGGPDTAYGRLLQPAGNVYFAGDHMSHVIAWQHGAFESARQTVTALHTRALAS